MVVAAMLGAAILEITAKNGSSQVSQLSRTSKTVNGLQLTTTLNKSQVKIGEQIVLNISVKNISKDELQVPGYGLLQGFGINVRTQKGEDMPLTEKGKEVQAGNYFISGKRFFI
jgi:hypothetical protein